MSNFKIYPRKKKINEELFPVGTFFITVEDCHIVNNYNYGTICKGSKFVVIEVPNIYNNRYKLRRIDNIGLTYKDEPFLYCRKSELKRYFKKVSFESLDNKLTNNE